MEITSKKALLLAALSGVLFGTTGLYVSNLAGISGIEISMFRNLLGFVFIAAYMLMTRKVPVVKGLKILVLAGLGNALINSGYVTSLSLGARLGDAAFLLDSGWLLSIGFSWLLLRERPDRRRLLYLVVALAGVALILKPLSLLQSTANLISLGAGVVFGYNVVVFRKSQMVHDSFTTLFYALLVSSLVLVPVSFPGFVMPSLSQAYYLIAYGLFGGVLPILLLTISVKYLRTYEAGVPALMEPVSATLFGLFLFGQVPDTLSLLGGALILIAIFLSSTVVEHKAKAKARH